jgi:uncharacterized protein YjbI with pentapeptide repeats
MIIKTVSGGIVAETETGDNCSLSELITRTKNLSGADFRNANLRGIDFQNTICSYACFAGANLEGARFDDVSCRHANFSRANLTCATFLDVNCIGADFSSADVSAALFRHVTLREAIFHEAILSTATFRYVDFSNANFTDAKICWRSHDLIAELLCCNAKSDWERRAIAGLVKISDGWCWDDFLNIPTPQREWALSVLRKYVKVNDGAPEILCV